MKSDFDTAAQCLRVKACWFVLVLPGFLSLFFVSVTVFVPLLLLKFSLVRRIAWWKSGLFSNQFALCSNHLLCTHKLKQKVARSLYSTVEDGAEAPSQCCPCYTSPVDSVNDLPQHKALTFLLKLAWCIRDDNTTFPRPLAWGLDTFIWFIFPSGFQAQVGAGKSCPGPELGLCILTSNRRHSVNCGLLYTMSHSAGIFWSRSRIRL